jgi:MFS transporter, MHS family, shikimate and dehydroshikimate transport protein
MNQSRVRSSEAQIRMVALASTVGCTIEWYDFFLYGTVSGLIFNKLFFPTFDPRIGTLLAYTTFAVGFITRPIGGIIFGHLGDRIGRKRMLVLTLLIMGLATFAIGLLPTYAQIGVAAPFLLLGVRVIQGIGLGGEWGGAVLMAAEHSPTGRRGFYASWPQIGVPAGLALGTGAFFLLSMLGENALLAYGWRIAFLASIVLVIVGIYIRLTILESPEFEAIRKSGTIARVPFGELVRTAWGNVVLGMGARYIEGVAFNLYGVFMISYLATDLKYSRSSALAAVTVAAIVLAFFVPFFGRLSDTYGRRRVFAGGTIATGVLVFPAFALMSMGITWAWVAIIIPFGIAYAALYGPEAALFCELFEPQVRYSGISFVYQFSGIFASGLTPIIATALLVLGHGAPWFVAGYAVIVSIISLVSVLAIRTTASDTATGTAASSAPLPASSGGS